jgi:peptidoglycan/xylan/chitin deacetylase (PgdA/CDA1 family)
MPVPRAASPHAVGVLLRRARPLLVVLVLCCVAVLLATPAQAAPAPVAAKRRGCTGQVALTFDDGPVRGTTHRLVRLLRQRHVPATFFMVGQRVQALPAVAREVERAGFLIGNHSWAHRNMRTQSYDDVVRTLRSTQRALRAAGVHPTRLMRPPYGAENATVRRAVHDFGDVPVLWSTDSLDWKTGDSQQIAARILASLRPGANIVLQHDGVTRSPLSVGAVDEVVRVARRRGYCFTALDERGRPGFPTPTTTLSARGGAEGGHAVVTVRLDREAGRDTAFTLTARSGTATVGEDLPALTSRVVIPAGQLKAKVEIPLVADGVAEPAEQFTVALHAPEGLRLGERSATLTVTDRAARPLPGPPVLQLRSGL